MGGTSKLTGARILGHFWAARRRRHLRGEELRQFQEQRARRVISFAVLRSRYYADHFRGLDLGRWREFPTTDKLRMMEYFDTYNTVGITRSEAEATALRAEQERDFRPLLQGHTVGLSSGTSGCRGLFLVSPAERAVWAGTVLERLMPPGARPGMRIAFFLRSNSTLYQSLASRWIDFRYLDLMLPLTEAVEILNQAPPNVLAGPPSLLVRLAEEQQLGRLRIAPKSVLSFAEVLDPEDRARVESGFQIRLGEVYQCTEGLLALSCSHGSLHVQEDLVALQTEATPDHPKTGVPVITDLWRLAQPMIRHRLNDLLSFSPKQCACGSEFRVIERIQGRCDDVTAFPRRAGGWRLVYPDTVRRMVLLAGEGVLDFQAVQARPGQLSLYLELQPGADREQVRRVLQEQVSTILDQYDCRVDQYEFVFGLPAQTASEKRRRVRRDGPLPEGVIL